MMPGLSLRALIALNVLLFSLYSTSSYASGAKRPQASEDTDYSQTAPVTPTPEVITEIPPTLPEELVTEKYSHLDPDKIVPPNHLKSALSFYEANQKIIKNKRYIVVIDFKQHNSKERFYLIDMEDGRVDTYLTAHGKNSDPDFDGYATKFSNTPDSLMTSLGFYLTAETYYGEHDYSLRLDGLSTTNSNVRARAIVIHGASYVRNIPLIGRSFGCPALDESHSTTVIDMIKNGALIFAAY